MRQPPEETAGRKADPRLALAHTEATRAIAQQQSLLSGIRTRAGALFGAANIATAFLAGVALKNQEFVVESWVATFCFAGVAVLTVVILLPRDGWCFENDSRMLVEEWIDRRDLDLDAIHRHLAVYMREHYEGNEKKIDRMLLYYVIASVLLGAEIFVWLIDLGRGAQ